MTPDARRIGTRAAVVAAVVGALWVARTLDRKSSWSGPERPSEPYVSVAPAAESAATDAGLRRHDAAPDADEDPFEAPAVVPLHPAPRASAIHVVVPPDASAPPVLPLSAADGEREISLLEKAQGALLSDPSQALTFADEDARRFARGPMREYAELIAIDALQRLGKRPQAEARARRFFVAFPTSKRKSRVEGILARTP